MKHHPAENPDRKSAEHDVAKRIHDAIEAAPLEARRAALAEVVDHKLLATQFRRGPTDTPDKPDPKGTGEAAGLYNIPYMLKDLFNIAGRVAGAGATFLHEAFGPADRDSLLVQRLRESGAVLAGKTHLNEFAYGLDGMNAHFGNCPHPYDSDRISGGSSSGSAWAVGRGIVPLAFGTDTGGSVRVPAALCGVYGVRMEPNAAAREGVVPLAPSFDTVGWFTRSPDLAAQVWRVLTKATSLAPDAQARPRDEASAGTAGGAATDTTATTSTTSATSMSGTSMSGTSTSETVEGIPATEPRPTHALRLLYLPREELVRDERLGEHYRHQAERLGADCSPHSQAAEWLAEETEKHVRAYNIIGSMEAYAFHEALLKTWADRYEPRVRALIERGAHWTPDEVAWARRVHQETQERILHLLSEMDALVMPTTHTIAPTFASADQDFRTRILSLTAPASLGGVPVVTAPVFVDDRLSGGLQFLIHPQSPDLVPRVLELFNRIS